MEHLPRERDWWFRKAVSTEKTGDTNLELSSRKRKTQMTMRKSNAAF